MCKLPFLRGEYDEELQYYALICFERNSFCHGKRNINVRYQIYFKKKDISTTVNSR